MDFNELWFTVTAICFPDSETSVIELHVDSELLQEFEPLHTTKGKHYFIK